MNRHRSCTFYSMKLSNIIESSLETDSNQHKNRLRQVCSCAKREYWYLLPECGFHNEPFYQDPNRFLRLWFLIQCKGSQSSSLCLLILCQTLFVWFEVFWKGIKLYVGVVCKVGGFIGGRRTDPQQALCLCFAADNDLHAALSYTNQDHEHMKPNKRLVREPQVWVCFRWAHTLELITPWSFRGELLREHQKHWDQHALPI